MNFVKASGLRWRMELRCGRVPLGKVRESR